MAGDRGDRAAMPALAQRQQHIDHGQPLADQQHRGLRRQPGGRRRVPGIAPAERRRAGARRGGEAAQRQHRLV
ncbi:hypothetical protein HMPREF0731_0007, partial [Pseudoroseomonas cervicalis ATCC 49957]